MNRPIHIGLFNGAANSKLALKNTKSKESACFSQLFYIYI